MSAPILMQYPAIIHKHVFTDSLYLVPLFPLGSIRTMFFDRISKFLLGEEASSSLGIKESKAPGLLEPAEAILQRAFCLLSALAQKALWYPSNLSFFHGLWVIISLTVRILAGNYNRMHYEGSHFMTRISRFYLSR